MRVKRLSRKKLCETFNVSYGAMSSYISGGITPPLDLIQRLCKEYDISIDDFVNKKLENINTKRNVSKKDAHDISDVKTKLYAEFEKTYNIQQTTIEAKNEIIEELRKRISLYKKQNQILETLLNQNNSLKDYILVKINSNDQGPKE